MKHKSSRPLLTNDSMPEQRVMWTIAGEWRKQIC